MIKASLDWMLKMQDGEGGVHHKVTGRRFSDFVMPDQDDEPLVVTPVTSTATADFCAVMALASEVLKDFDQERSHRYLDAALNAYDWLGAHPDLVFKNPDDIKTAF